MSNSGEDWKVIIQGEVLSVVLDFLDDETFNATARALGVRESRLFRAAVWSFLRRPRDQQHQFLAFMHSHDCDLLQLEKEEDSKDHGEQ